MVRAWYMDNSAENQRLENHKNPSEFIDLDTLYKISGVQHFKVNEKNLAQDEVINEIRTEKGYTYDEEVTCSKECLPNYEEKLKIFYREHMHNDEAIRLVLEGSGYFDVRDENDKWIRIEVVAGDLLILPGGIYHRFSLDLKNYIKVKRYFINKQIWTSHHRPAKDMEMVDEKIYLEKLNNDQFTSFAVQV